MNENILNLINPKSLEKQLKAVEGRMQTLQAEIAELQKIKEACLVLLGTAAPQPEPVEVVAAPTSGKAKKKKNAADDESVDVISASSLEAGDDASFN